MHLLSDMECRNFFSTGHSEYDRDTLAKEYFRDAEKGLDIDLPENYFPDNDPAKNARGQVARSGEYNFFKLA